MLYTNFVVKQKEKELLLTFRGDFLIMLDLGRP